MTPTPHNENAVAELMGALILNSIFCLIIACLHSHDLFKGVVRRAGTCPDGNNTYNINKQIELFRNRNSFKLS